MQCSIWINRLFLEDYVYIWSLQNLVNFYLNQLEMAENWFSLI